MDKQSSPELKIRNLENRIKELELFQKEVLFNEALVAYFEYYRKSAKCDIEIPSFHHSTYSKSTHEFALKKDSSWILGVYQIKEKTIDIVNGDI